MTRVVLNGSWTSEEFAKAISSLSATHVDPGECVELEWRGGQPSIWKLAWVAECLRTLQQSGIEWQWLCPG